MPRSPELMSRHDTALLVIDVQEKLVPLIPGHARLVWNIGRLIDGARLLGLPVGGVEQYPQGLGTTVAPLRERLQAAGLAALPAKRTFSCGGRPDLFAAWDAREVARILVAGIETHVCVQQTVFDLLASGRRVYVAADAVGARHEIDSQIALRRMESAGATLTTVESALFEWCETAAAPEFKQLSQLVREAPPGVDGPSIAIF